MQAKPMSSKPSSSLIDDLLKVPENVDTSRDLLPQINDFVKQLPLAQQQVLFLRYDEMNNFPTISKRLSCSVTTARLHHARALHAIRKAFIPAYADMLKRVAHSVIVGQ